MNFPLGKSTNKVSLNNYVHFLNDLLHVAYFEEESLPRKKHKQGISHANGSVCG